MAQGKIIFFLRISLKGQFSRENSLDAFKLLFTSAWNLVTLEIFYDERFRVF